MARAGLDKQPRDVARMFDDVAERYDVTNDVLSMGQDRRWRRATLMALDVHPGDRVLDLAAGTGTSTASFALAGATVLLVDDILDEGHTLKGIRDYCLGEGAERVLIAVLCEKRHGRCVEGLAADFVGVEVPDRYVFGFGMDFHEQGRNLPAIYAVDA